jgi:hypothetical protein
LLRHGQVGSDPHLWALDPVDIRFRSIEVEQGEPAQSLSHELIAFQGEGESMALAADHHAGNVRSWLQRGFFPLRLRPANQ